jgi:hypothetical protein
MLTCIADPFNASDQSTPHLLAYHNRCDLHKVILGTDPSSLGKVLIASDRYCRTCFGNDASELQRFMIQRNLMEALTAPSYGGSIKRSLVETLLATAGPGKLDNTTLYCILA